jgi:hypothetical protein
VRAYPCELRGYVDNQSAKKKKEPHVVADNDLFVFGALGLFTKLLKVYM